MKIAVIKTGGKQYLVKEKDTLRIEKLKDVEAKAAVEFETMLVADGDNLEIGTPVLSTKVKATVNALGKTSKVIGIKYKPKTRQHKKFGHRQEFAEVTIKSI